MRSKIQQFIWKTLLFLVFLRPFLSEYVFFITGFWYIFALIFFSVSYIIISEEEVTLLPSSYNLPVSLFIISILISLFYSGLNEWSSLQLYLLLPNIFIFYIATTLKSGQKTQLIAVMFISAIIISLYAIFQYLSNFSFIKPNIYIDGFIIGKRVFSTFLSPNMLASYMIMMLPLGTGFLITTTKKNRSLWIFIALIIMLVTLLLTKSLGGIVVFIIIFILLVFLSRNLKLSSLSISLILLLLISIPFFFSKERLSQFLNFDNPNNPIMQRIYYWSSSLKVIKDFPLTGAGWGKLEHLYRLYKVSSSNVTSYSHNVFLQILVESGLLGLLSFSGIVFMFLKSGLRVLKENSSQQPYMGLFCAGCGFLLHNLIDLSFYFGQVAFFWWIILGLFAEVKTSLSIRTKVYLGICIALPLICIHQVLS
ncbi:MAG: O-antigen ligase family protein [Candidatus Omnitrophica bacterium]|nr:O-antigen ligase family protein [Candidatus Omnitrophota bacterium]